MLFYWEIIQIMYWTIKFNIIDIIDTQNSPIKSKLLIIFKILINKYDTKCAKQKKNINILINY